MTPTTIPVPIDLLERLIGHAYMFLKFEATKDESAEVSANIRAAEALLNQSQGGDENARQDGSNHTNVGDLVAREQSDPSPAPSPVQRITAEKPRLSPRDMATRFLSAPLHIKIEIATKAGVLERGDAAITPDVEMCKTFFRRATERNKVAELSAAISELTKGRPTAPDSPTPPEERPV